MNRELTQGEREMLANACFHLAAERRAQADEILKTFPKDETFQMMAEFDEESSHKLERLAGTIVARYRRLIKSAASYGTLGDFIVRPANKVTVDCLITIPEQA